MHDAHLAEVHGLSQAEADRIGDTEALHGYDRVIPCPSRVAPSKAAMVFSPTPIGRICRGHTRLVPKWLPSADP